LKTLPTRQAAVRLLPGGLRFGGIEAHIFVAFVAYCLQVTLKQRSRTLAPGLTTRAVLEKFAAMQMVDVHLPLTDRRHLILADDPSIAVTLVVFDRHALSGDIFRQMLLRLCAKGLSSLRCINAL
jgi:hypothetical protein